MVKISSILQIITYLVVGVSYAAVFQYVETYYSASFASLLALSIYLNFNRFLKIPRWLLNSISLGVLTISALTITTEYLVEPVLGALLVLIAIKLLDDKAFRDYAQIFAMCVFVLIGSSLLSLSIAFLGYFSLTAVLATSALILLAYFAQDSEIAIQRRNLNKVFLQSLLICAIALPGSLIFFVILPRTNYPILSFLNREGYARAGFTDRINLGEIAEIQENNLVIFRAQMSPIDDQDLYWRGIVLDQFDGKSWKSGAVDTSSKPSLRRGPQVEQTIYLEPYGNRFLFALDKPQSILHRHVERAQDLTYSLSTYIDERVRYKAVSVITDFLVDQSPGHSRYVQLPADFSPRMERLVAELSHGRQGGETLQALLAFFRQGDFQYSMKNLPTTDNPLEDFLFQNRSGNCEFFASSLAVMLRMAKIPARLVGGYRGGYYNRAAGYYMVLQNNAHVWVEAYLPEKQGWLRIDPTLYSRADASVSPDHGVFMRLKLMLDTFNYYWYKFIINYDFSKQLALIRKLKATIQKPDVQIDLAKHQIKRYLLYLLAAAPAFLLICALYRAVRRRPHEKLMARFEGRMSQLGYQRKRSEGLEEFVARIEDRRVRVKAAQFVNRFESVYYRDLDFSSHEIQALQRRLNEL
ncbi:transglutaminaseTgpA domain-containing protein [Desulfoferrobacter suflitae]|uniref:transglutaminase family protein n=1 Tax=Desulfoferrobacter suflitae TaxID=2865782 RepID=UPI0021642D24|nr:transglutaminaseTgpA domain-containing protein [Desulfoferrobacter suflitae]MCK8602579.1 transglutaminaseTgpA domain-containing protein [Desulfoferrobacter suflitae]